MSRENPEAGEIQEVTQKAIKGVGWNYLSYGLGKLLSLATVSILAHILTPETFGIVALATVAVNYLSSVRELGLGAALVQLRERVSEASDTVFTINILIGVSLASIAFLIAPPVAQYFEEPLVIPVLRWLGLSFLIKSLGSVHQVHLQRELDFRKKLIPELGNTVLKGIVSIVLALTGYGVWALVFGQLVGATVSVFLLWRVHPWRPKLAIHGDIARGLFKFGTSVLIVDFVSIIEDNFDYLLIGRFFGKTALGIYTNAYRLPEMLAISTLWIMGAVFYPMFSAIQNNQDAMKTNILNTIRYVQYIIAPICLGLSIAADPIIRVFFGEQWIEAIPVLRILALYALVLSIGFHIGDYYKAIGRPDILAKIEVPIFFLRITLLWAGAQHSIVGVAVAHLIAAIIEATVRLIVASRLSKITLGEIFSQLTAFVAGLVLLILSATALYFTRGHTDLLRLLSVVGAGGFGYISILWLLERKNLRYIALSLGLIKSEI